MGNQNPVNNGVDRKNVYHLFRGYLMKALLIVSLALSVNAFGSDWNEEVSPIKVYTGVSSDPSYDSCQLRVYKFSSLGLVYDLVSLKDGVEFAKTAYSKTDKIKFPKERFSRKQQYFNILKAKVGNGFVQSETDYERSERGGGDVVLMKFTGPQDNLTSVHMSFTSEVRELVGGMIQGQCPSTGYDECKEKMRARQRAAITRTRYSEITKGSLICSELQNLPMSEWGGEED